MSSIGISDQEAELHMLRQRLALLEQRTRELTALHTVTVAQLREARDQLVAKDERLERTNRELSVTHDLAMALQSTPDIADIQDRVLTLITGALGFERAILALADPDDSVLTGWLCSTHSAGAGLQRIPHTTQLPLKTTSGLLAQAVLEPQPLLVEDARQPTNDPQINAWLEMRCYAILPMVTRNRLLGVLLVDNPASGRPITPDDLVSLTNIASQAAMAIGSVQLCIDRTQRLAIEEERSRIAMEIHDAISQQLYGITYTLDASVKLLPDHADEVRHRLSYLLPQAQHATAAIRHAIFDLWPNELDAERFGAELRGYAQDIAPATELQVGIQLDPHFNALAIGIRRQFYRIAQEALANTVKHAQARHVEITFTIEATELRLMIVDDGQGFDPAGNRLESNQRPHFGLLSMRERAQSLGGSLQIESYPERGTRITVVLPRVC
jgi:signal transduction histidine kinase